MKSIYKIDRRKFLRISTVFSTGLGLSAYSFKTKRNFRFGLVTDSHYADREPANTRYYRQSLDKMEDFIDVMNREKVDFIVHLGDFKDQDPKKMERDTLKYLIKLESIFSKFQSHSYHCVGNHDVDSITKQQFLENISNTGISKSKSYYSFDNKGFHFVVLDANYHNTGKDHFYKEGADWQDTNIPKLEIDWLVNDLNKTKLPTVIFCHHPLYKYEDEYSKMYVNNYEEVQNVLIDSEKVMVVFQGHVHDERYKKVNGIHYVTQYGMVDYSGLENNSFSIVEIDKKSIKINGYKRVSDMSFN